MGSTCQLANSQLLAVRYQDFCVNEPFAIFWGSLKGSFLAGTLGVILEEWETIKEQFERFIPF